MMKRSIILIFLFGFFWSTLHAQTVQRNNYSVFSSFAVNDSLLIASGQVLTKSGELPSIEHGYYPLNGSLLHVQDVASEFDYQIYPNPTNSIVTVLRSSYSTEPIVFSLYTLEGRFVISYFVDAAIFQLDLSALSSGIYQLSILENNGTVYSQKLVKVN